jgi:hypothetical protein
VGVRELPGVRTITSLATSKAAEFGLEQEMNQLKDLCENPEKIVEQMSNNVELAIIDPSQVVKRVNDAKQTIVKIKPFI